MLYNKLRNIGIVVTTSFVNESPTLTRKHSKDSFQNSFIRGHTSFVLYVRTIYV